MKTHQITTSHSLGAYMSFHRMAWWLPTSGHAQLYSTDLFSQLFSRFKHLIDDVRQLPFNELKGLCYKQSMLQQLYHHVKSYLDGWKSLVGGNKCTPQKTKNRKSQKTNNAIGKYNKKQKSRTIESKGRWNMDTENHKDTEEHKSTRLKPIKQPKRNKQPQRTRRRQETQQQDFHTCENIQAKQENTKLPSKSVTNKIKHLRIGDTTILYNSNGVDKSPPAQALALPKHIDEQNIQT